MYTQDDAHEFSTQCSWMHNTHLIDINLKYVILMEVCYSLWTLCCTNVSGLHMFIVLRIDGHCIILLLLVWTFHFKLNHVHYVRCAFMNIVLKICRHHVVHTWTCPWDKGNCVFSSTTKFARRAFRPIVRFQILLGLKCNFLSLWGPKWDSPFRKDLGEPDHWGTVNWSLPWFI